MTVTSYGAARKERSNYIAPVEGDTSSSGATESDYQEFSPIRPTLVRNFRQAALEIFFNVVASVKMEAQRKIRKESRTKKALQREVCKLREYCLKQEYELQFYRLILQQNRIPLPTVLRIPRSPLTMSVTAEVNEHCLKSLSNDESYICEKSSSNTEE
ncbi:conserved hypothetical protein [Trichinella spiralis]|uniref:hypothetical protein n=1 Tax=Trichinella spiralis TaxID=6334 RepID=UPI0001EFC259|nr:conserved hypothetical protein [Trichinella spiralis]